MPADEATVVLRSAHVHSFASSEPFAADDDFPLTSRAMALSGDRVIRLGTGINDLDDLIGRGTSCLDLTGHCVLPGFVDAHVHQLEATQDLGSVDLASARSIAELLDLLRRSSSNPISSWIVSHRSWHESNLAEGRLPSTDELDRVTTEHPVMVRRGSQTAVLNSEGIRRSLRAQVIDEDARHTGRVCGLAAIRAILGSDMTNPEDAPNALARVCANHAARGIVGARDAGIAPNDIATYEQLVARDGLAVRTDAMVAVPKNLDHGEKLAFLSQLGPPPGRRSHLSVTGVKVFADGHIADAALRPETGGRQVAPGRLLMTAAEIVEVADRAVAMGWRVGCHAVGDRALDATLDAYEHVRQSHPALPAGHLTVEHALIADESQRLRTARLGVGVTVQHPLLDLYGAQMIAEWGDELTNRASPVRSWLASGALVAAGSDGHVAPFDPIRSISGLVTRRTASAGVLGAAEGVSIQSAIRLYSVGSQWLAGWGAPAGLVEGGLADLVVFDRCLLEVEPEELQEGIAPLLTVCGGSATHDPYGIWPERMSSIG